MNRVMSVEDTTMLLFLFQTPTPNNQREREFHSSVSPKPEEP